jgi:murein DD-endopeptidase MepM/ murein hydrolase activator NlpD
MTAWLRILAFAGAGLIVWTTAASRVAEQTRLPVGSVVAGAAITQPFGCTTLLLEPFAPFCPSLHIHTGIDLAAREGTPVRAATGGVARVGYDAAGAGIFVAIRFDAHARVLYCHLLRAEVASGEVIIAGQTIGLVGSTGLATGPHVHLEVQIDGRAVDPTQWLSASGP